MSWAKELDIDIEIYQSNHEGDIIDKNPGTDKLGVTKGGEGEIEAITASTITSRAFLLAINNAFKAYKATPVE